MAHPAYKAQLRDEIKQLISDAMDSEEITERDAQNVLLELAGEMTPFEPPTVRGEVV